MTSHRQRQSAWIAAWCCFVWACMGPASAAEALFPPPIGRPTTDSNVLPASTFSWEANAEAPEPSGESFYSSVSTLDDGDLALLSTPEESAANWAEPEAVYAPCAASHYCPCGIPVDEPWSWQVLPRSLIWRSYLAGPQESRFRSVWNYEQDDGWIWDISLGGRAGILRYGTTGDYFPQGFQLDIEGAALLRLDPEENRDLVGTDYRFGVPLTYGLGRWQTKFAYYHVSSHLGDERMISHPDDVRINLVRDALVWGLSYYVTDDLRIYGEVGWAFYHQISQPFELQFGFDYSPYAATGFHGAPFVAANYHLREELRFGGPINLQAGWQWRSQPGSGIFRLGVQYYNGADNMYQFFRNNQEKVGVGIWYDF